MPWQAHSWGEGSQARVRIMRDNDQIIITVVIPITDTNCTSWNATQNVPMCCHDSRARYQVERFVSNHQYVILEDRAKPRYSVRKAV